MANNKCQKKPNFLGIKVVQFWCYRKSIKTKNMLLNWYFSTKIFFRKIWRIFYIENQISTLFDVYFWPLKRSHEKINTVFVISAIIASVWNVFIKFRWHDEKITLWTLQGELNIYFERFTLSNHTPILGFLWNIFQELNLAQV